MHSKGPDCGFRGRFQKKRLRSPKGGFKVHRASGSRSGKIRTPELGGAYDMYLQFTCKLRKLQAAG